MSEVPAIADGVHHQLDPRVIPLERTVHTLAVLGVSLLTLVGLVVFWLAADDLPVLAKIVPIVIWTLAVGAATWHARVWPARAYGHASYRVDARGLQIRRGVYWREEIDVPLSRVQHIDVTQGPFERKHGLGTLVVYTAGTHHARVALNGLEHGRALAIREHLLPQETSDAV